MMALCRFVKMAFKGKSFDFVGKKREREGGRGTEIETSHPEAIDGQRFPCPALLFVIICFTCKQGSGLKEDDVL